MITIRAFQTEDAIETAQVVKTTLFIRKGCYSVRNGKDCIVSMLTGKEDTGELPYLFEQLKCVMTDGFEKQIEVQKQIQGKKMGGNRQWYI